MKLGIVGSGLIVTTLFQFVKEIESIEVVAISGTERSKDKLEQLSKDFDIKYTYTNYQDFLRNDEFSTVYVAVPNHLHFEFAYKALAANKNVILEKPFTTTYDDAKRLADLAKEKHLVLIEAISNQYNPNYLKIKEVLPQIGDVKILTLNYTQYSSRYDAFKKGEILPVFDYTKAGGALMDLNVYNIHFAVGLFGMPKKVKYYPNIERKVDTSGILIMEYEGFQATLIAAKDCGSPFINSIQGNEGCIYTQSPLFTLTDFSFQLNKSEAIRYDLTENKHRMKHEFEKFAEVIDENQYEFALKMLEHSLNVMNILYTAREEANLVF